MFQNPSTGFYELTAIFEADAADFEEDGDVDGIDFRALWMTVGGKFLSAARL